jgi:hypothetical protein
LVLAGPEPQLFSCANSGPKSSLLVPDFTFTKEFSPSSPHLAASTFEFEDPSSYGIVPEKSQLDLAMTALWEDCADQGLFRCAGTVHTFLFLSPSTLTQITPRTKQASLLKFPLPPTPVLQV